jgi:hypothetical protein
MQGWGVGGDVGRGEAQVDAFAGCISPRDEGFGGEEGRRGEGVAGGQLQCVRGGGLADSFVNFWTDTRSEEGEDEEEEACSDARIDVRQQWLRERRDARQGVDRVDLVHACSAATEGGGGEGSLEMGQGGEREGGQRGEGNCIASVGPTLHSTYERDCIASSKHLDRCVFSEVSVQWLCVVNSNHAACIYIYIYIIYRLCVE